MTTDSSISVQTVDDATGFVIREHDSETFELFLNGQSLTTLTHDEDGWGGIDRMTTLVNDIARILGIPVKQE
jgi:hypothetical protein